MCHGTIGMLFLLSNHLECEGIMKMRNKRVARYNSYEHTNKPTWQFTQRDIERAQKWLDDPMGALADFTKRLKADVFSPDCHAGFL